MNTNKASQAAVPSSIHPPTNGRHLVSRPAAAELLPLYASLLPRARLCQLLGPSGQRFYWRSLTPLVMLWGMLYQRLDHDHTCDAALGYLRSGAVDWLDAADRHAQPLSQRLRSESTAGYVQGRNRLPLALIQAALAWVAQQVQAWLAATPATAQWRWHGRAVRVLDGTTFRLRPAGDLVSSYGQAANQQGHRYWVVAKALASFCLQTQVCTGYAEGPQSASEPGLFAGLLAQEPAAQCIYLADQGLGVYRVAQVARHDDHDVVLRLERKVAQRLLRLAHCTLASGQEQVLSWPPSPTTVCEPGLAQDAIAGRLLYLHLERDGWRPLDIYLFTTLLAEQAYPLAAICELYAQRWRGELDFRHLKTVLGMEGFAVQSAALFRKELAVGLLAYNLICVLMTQAALEVGLRPSQLSFSRCRRRIAAFFAHGLPAWATAQSEPLTDLRRQLAQCRLPEQPDKVQHEPRRLRRRQASYPPLIGDRDVARQQLRQKIAGQPNS